MYYGFINKYWTHISDFMLEKKLGERHIHQLRIIGKVSAEFNTCLKFLLDIKQCTTLKMLIPAMNNTVLDLTDLLLTLDYLSQLPI
jgi:hypothetical protein